MQGEFDYRGLHRHSMLILLPVLIAGSWGVLLLAAPLMLMALPFGAAAIAGSGVLVVVGAVVIPLVGIMGGLWGMARARAQVLRQFGAVALPESDPAVQTTARLAERLGLPCPDVYVYPDEDLNAWATGSGPTRGAVGLSKGALDRLGPDELEAVIAHELGHIGSSDIRRMQFAIGFQKAVYWFLFHRSLKRLGRLSFGCVSELGITGLSRRREYWADAVGAALTSPEAMIAALEALHHDGRAPPRKRKHLNQYLLRWKGRSLFGTHPTLSQRVRALETGTYYAAVLRKISAGRQAGWDAVLNEAEGDFGSRPVRRRLVARPYRLTWDEVPFYAAITVPAMLLSAFSTNAYLERLWPRDAATVIVPHEGTRVAGWQEQANALVLPAAVSVPSDPATVGQRCIGLAKQHGKWWIQTTHRGNETVFFTAGGSSQESEGLVAVLDRFRKCLEAADGYRRSKNVRRDDGAVVENWFHPLGMTDCDVTPNPVKFRTGAAVSIACMTLESTD